MSDLRSNPVESPKSLVIERVFPHPQEKLWRALTEGRLLAQWMMNNDFEPVVGRKFQFRAEPMPNWNGVVDCEVLVVDPMQRLSYNWGVGGGDSGLQWVVTWTLTQRRAAHTFGWSSRALVPIRWELIRAQSMVGRNSSVIWSVSLGR